MQTERKSTLYIIRGLPGSGKSTLARRLVLSFRHRETDMFFIKNSIYKWNRKDVKKAIDWCYSEVEDCIKFNPSQDMAVSNTFIKRSHFMPYIELAKKYNFEPMVISCHADFGNIHKVCVEDLERMKSNWESYC